MFSNIVPVAHLSGHSGGYDLCIIFLTLGYAFFILISPLLRFIPKNPDHGKRH